jgi:hypothetical protein
MLREIAGAATTIDTAWDVDCDFERGELYVLSKDDTEILVFPVAAAGNVAPVRSLSTLPAWSTHTSDFALDLVNDEIVVASRPPGPAAIVLLRRGDDGFVSVLRSISGAATGLIDPSAVAVDPVHDEIFVVQDGSIRVFARGANGDVAPLRTISGAATGILAPCGVAVDPAAGEISVVRTSPDEAILFFPRTAQGDVAPVRTIVGAATMINGPSLHAYYPRLVFADGFEAAVAFESWSVVVP